MGRDTKAIQELARSVHIDARDEDGRTVLMRAAEAGDQTETSPAVAEGGG